MLSFHAMRNGTMASYLNGLKPGAVSKFFFYLSIALGAIFSQSIFFLVLLFLGLVVAGMFTARSPSGIANAVRYSLPFSLAVFVLHLFSHGGDRIFQFLFLTATFEGAYAGLLYAFKLIIFALSGYMIFTTVDPFDLVSPLERIARKSKRLTTSASSILLAFVLALRFLPELTSRARITVLALRSRGVDFKGNLRQRAGASLLLLPPLFAGAIKQAEISGMALDVKGFGTRFSRAVLAPPRIVFASSILSLIALVILIAGWSTR